MKKAKILCLLLLLISARHCIAGDKRVYIGNPLDMPMTGWYKVLCMKNGNTLLFHIDNNKPLVVKVFDSTHKEIRHQSHLLRDFDVSKLQLSAFKGLFEVNKEAVLFFEQEHQNRYVLIRVRIDGSSGKLIEEKQLGESQNLLKRTYYFVTKGRADDGYAILYCMDDNQFKKCNVHVTYYDNTHEQVRDLGLDVDRKKYDYMFATGAEATANGMNVTLTLLKMEMNATASGRSPQRAVYDHHIALYHIPKDATHARCTVVDASTDVYPNYAKYSYNPFADATNVLLYSYLPIRYTFGGDDAVIDNDYSPTLNPDVNNYDVNHVSATSYATGVDIRRGSVSENLFFKTDAAETKLNYLHNQLATDYLRSKTDTNRLFYGIPLSMFTNENGLSTVISEKYERFDEPESGSRYAFETHLGDIAITQVDDNGNELWGTVIPHAECIRSYKRFYNPYEFSRKKELGYLYSDLPGQIYAKQFMSANSYICNKELFIVLNDYARNIERGLSEKTDTIYDHQNTDAFYYKVNRKREISMDYLFGKQAPNVHICGLTEGADYDEQRGVYASLVQFKRGETITLRMAWRQLD